VFNQAIASGTAQAKILQQLLQGEIVTQSQAGQMMTYEGNNPFASAGSTAGAMPSAPTQ
jgi:ribosomal protein S19E (S16A)